MHPSAFVEVHEAKRPHELLGFLRVSEAIGSLEVVDQLALGSWRQPTSAVRCSIVLVAERLELRVGVFVGPVFFAFPKELLHARGLATGFV